MTSVRDLVRDPVRDDPGAFPVRFGEDARALLPDVVDPACFYCIVLAALPFPESSDQVDRICAFHRRVLQILQCLA